MIFFFFHHRKGNVCVYKFVSSSGIEFSHYEHIDPADNANRLFIVCYLTWEPGFVLPMGVVVGMLNPDDSLDKGIQVKFYTFSSSASCWLVNLICPYVFL